MKRKNIGLTPKEEKDVVRLAARLTPDGKKMFTQEELASKFFVAPVTIRRALAEAGVIKLVGYKTRIETAMLEYLSMRDIQTVADLKDLFTECHEINKVLIKHEIEDPKALDWALSGSQP